MTIESRHDTLPQSNKQPGLVERPKHKECLSCRLIGTATLGGVGSYALWQSRATAPGSLGQKRVVAGLGVGLKFTLLTCTVILILDTALLVGSVFRWFQCKLQTCLINYFHFNGSNRISCSIQVYEGSELYTCLKFAFLFSAKADIPSSPSFSTL